MMSFRTSILAIGCAAVALPVSTAAQVNHQVFDSARTNVVDALRTPVAGGPIASSLPSAVFSAGRDKKVDIQMVLELGFDSLTGLDYRLTAGGSAPLDERAQQTIMASLAGLSTGTTLKLALSGTHWNDPADPGAVVEWCEARKRDTNPRRRLPPATDCEELTAASIPPSLRAEHDRITGWSNPWIFQVSGEISRAGLDYIDPGDLAFIERAGSAWSAGVAAGGFIGTGFYSGGASYARGFKPARTAEVCAPISPAGFRCRTEPLGAPTEVRGVVVDAQTRRFVGPRFGYNLHVRYRFADSVWGAELPLYFMPARDGGLLGGVAPSYDAENGWALQLFVGAALGFQL